MPYWGCIPSKLIVRAGNALAEADRVNRLAGRAITTPAWAPVAARVREATADWDDQLAVERFQAKGGRFLRGQARIVGPREVEVDGRRLRARRGIVLASGGEPAVPPIDGLARVDFWTNREAIEAAELPRSLVVLGAGPVGLELAQAFHRLGTAVTLVEVGEHALPMEEPEQGAAMDEVVRAEGMTLHTGVSAVSVKPRNGGVGVWLSDGKLVEAERLLVATGRRLDLSGLGVQAAGLDPAAPAVTVDPHLRAAAGLWAVGDVTGKGAFTHLAVYQGRIAAADILGVGHEPADYTAVPRVTFTDPEVASVGLTEAQARDVVDHLRVGVAQTASSARGWIPRPRRRARRGQAGGRRRPWRAGRRLSDGPGRRRDRRPAGPGGQRADPGRRPAGADLPLPDVRGRRRGRPAPARVNRGEACRTSPSVGRHRQAVTFTATGHHGAPLVAAVSPWLARPSAAASGSDGSTRSAGSSTSAVTPAYRERRRCTLMPCRAASCPTTNRPSILARLRSTGRVRRRPADCGLAAAGPADGRPARRDRLARGQPQPGRRPILRRRDRQETVVEMERGFLFVMAIGDGSW
jgi:pyruvate/2-oxoglutarate dehydrogenase complex dihydrolipoamide dehydrogenase (E3) component